LRVIGRLPGANQTSGPQTEFVPLLLL
jgi:hypothetical protein